MFHSSLLATFFSYIYHKKIVWCIRHGTFNLGKSKILTILIGKFILPLISRVPKKLYTIRDFQKNIMKI